MRQLHGRGATCAHGAGVVRGAKVRAQHPERRGAREGTPDRRGDARQHGGRAWGVVVERRCGDAACPISTG